MAGPPKAMGTHLNIGTYVPSKAFPFWFYKGRLEAISTVDASSIEFFASMKEMSTGASNQIGLHIHTQHWPTQSILLLPSIIVAVQLAFVKTEGNTSSGGRTQARLKDYGNRVLSHAPLVFLVLCPHLLIGPISR
jgi:hypothetical protein